MLGEGGGGIRGKETKGSYGRDWKGNLPSHTHDLYIASSTNQHHLLFAPCPQVTKLERDASSGTALQEITFWLNLENALNKIHRKRHSPEVNLTLDVLKAGKRFHATVSFDSDTGEWAGYLNH